MSFQDDINAVIKREIERRIDVNSEVIDRQAEILFELRGKLNAVLAENVALKSFVQKECCAYRSGMVVNAEAYLPETPATDAILNEVRADGVKQLADAWYAICNSDSKMSDSTRLQYRQRADDAADFAAQLRTGSTEGGV